MTRALVAAGVSVLVGMGACAVSDLPPASRPAPASRAEPAAQRPSRSHDPRPASPEPVRPVPSDAELEARFGASRPLSVSRGQATYYGEAFEGRRTASGEAFDPRAFTAAH